MSNAIDFLATWAVVIALTPIMLGAFFVAVFWLLGWAIRRRESNP
jgi:hypothetical protein